jgi:carbamoyl-phosphate synthase large subunit
LSGGTRNKIVQYFKKELGNQGMVMVADCNELAPALYDADRHFIVPRIDEEGYIDRILNICKVNNVKMVISLIDPELSLIAKYRKEFLDNGTEPIVSDYQVIEMCLNKYEMFQFLNHNGFNVVRNYVDKKVFYKDVEAGRVSYPVFIKPIKGSASINVHKVASQEEADLLFIHYDGLITQECMEGIEYGADVYIDMISGEPVAIFTKEKIRMRDGETDKSKSIKDKLLFELIKRFVKSANLKGIIDIDIFKVNGEYYILEVNPRFGGGYLHAYECGVNVFKMMLNNIKGIVNEDVIGKYEEDIYMMKYNEVKIIRKNLSTV